MGFRIFNKRIYKLEQKWQSAKVQNIFSYLMQPWFIVIFGFCVFVVVKLTRYGGHALLTPTFEGMSHNIWLQCLLKRALECVN